MQVLLNLLAGVALLVWGAHNVRTGVMRLYGGNLRRVLRRSVRSRFSAMLAGLGITGLIQSSTATALMVASFAGQGLIATAPALAAMLGADIGTSLMVIVFSLDLSWLSPLLIFVGVVLFLSRESTKLGRIGRILIGLGLIIMALQWIMLATKPVTEAAGVKVLFASLTGDVLLDMLVASLFAILCYSSLAVVLLIATLAASHLIGLHVALGLVLGANLGSGIVSVLNTLRSAPEARRVTVGSLLFKLAACLLVVPFVGMLEPLLAPLGDPARQVVLFHLLFNLAKAALFLFLTEPLARMAERMLPSPPPADDPTKPRHLDESALETPTLAMSCAAREALRIGDVIEQMLTGMLKVVKTNDRQLAERLRKMDDIVDKLYTAVKLYLARIPREALEEEEGRRWTDIVSFTINMEQIGDIIERIVIDVEDKKIDKGRNFSEAGMTEICDLHARLIANLRLGLSIFLNNNLKSAQELLAQKVLFRELERAYANSHLERLAGHTQDSIETSSLHLDLIADLRRINSHICSIAYPILEQAGVLARTRLKNEMEDAEIEAVVQRRTGGGGTADDGWQKRKPHTA